MPGKHLYEYAVIRAVPRVDREEFVNVGVILYCRDMKFLEMKFMVDERRLRSLHYEVDIMEVLERLKAFKKVCCGVDGSGPIGKLQIASRFRWLAAARSTIIQVSPVHPGLTDDPQQCLDRLFQQLVE